MSTQRTIDALSNPTVAVDDALRGMLIVGSRIKSDAIKQWVNAELYGYKDGMTVPEYRRLSQGDLLVEVHFSGPGGNEFFHTFGFSDLPKELRTHEEGLGLLQPVQSLSRLSSSDKKTKAAMPLPAQWSGLYNDLSSDGRVPLRTPFYAAAGARILLDKGLIGDVVSAVRTSALELLLELEEINPHVGEPGGPTVKDDDQLKGMEVRIGQLHGPLIVTAGSGNTISAQSSEGDLTVIYEKAAEYVNQEGVEQLESALAADGGRPGVETERFLEKVKSGAVGLAAGMTTNVAYDGLVTLIQSLI